MAIAIPQLDTKTRARDAIVVKGRRFPARKLIQQTWGISTADTTYAAPVAIVTNLYVTTVAGPNTTTITLTLAASAPDYARNVIVTVTHGSSIVACSGTITGTDWIGNVISEAWAVTATGTSKTSATKQAFATVTAITATSASDASANSIIVGTGNVFGLFVPAGVASAVKELEDTTVVTTGTMLAAGTAPTNDAFGTYAPSTAPNASHTYTIYYLSDGSVID